MMDILTQPDFIPVLVVFMKIICFILGYLTIRLGYKLINSGVKGEFKFTGSYHGIKGGLISSSPGLLFVLLGVLLIAYAIGVNKNFTSSKTYSQSPDTLYIPQPPQKIDSLH